MSPTAEKKGQARPSMIAQFHQANESVVDEVYDKILSRIIQGKVAAGEILTCTRLAEELRVSRTPVVSALERMISDGILIKEKHYRARVRTDAESWLIQVHSLREIVEPPAAGLAAEHIDEATLAVLHELATLAEPNSSNQWQQMARELDYALHLSIADHAHNLPLRETIRRCWKFKHLSYELGCTNPELEEIGYGEHLAILSALSKRDSKTASIAMLYHLRSSLSLTKVRQIV